MQHGPYLKTDQVVRLSLRYGVAVNPSRAPTRTRASPPGYTKPRQSPPTGRDRSHHSSPVAHRTDPEVASFRARRGFLST